MVALSFRHCHVVGSCRLVPRRKNRLHLSRMRARDCQSLGKRYLWLLSRRGMLPRGIARMSGRGRHADCNAQVSSQACR